MEYEDSCSSSNDTHYNLNGAISSSTKITIPVGVGIPVSISTNVFNNDSYVKIVEARNLHILEKTKLLFLQLDCDFREIIIADCKKWLFYDSLSSHNLTKDFIDEPQYWQWQYNSMTYITEAQYKPPILDTLTIDELELLHTQAVIEEQILNQKTDSNI